MRSPHAVRASVVTYGQAKTKCDSTGRPTGDRAASFSTIKKALCEGIGIPAGNLKEIQIKTAKALDHAAASHLEHSDVIVLVSEGSASLLDMRQALRESGIDEQIRYRHRCGACVLAVGETSNLLGAICPVGHGPGDRVDGLCLCPFMLCLEVPLTPTPTAL